MATLSRWLITLMQESWWFNDKTIILITDVPCHLWLNYNQEGIVVHPRITWSRGVPSTRDPHLGFNIEGTLEQAEAGDTLTHSFTFSYPYICKTYWYYFTGEIASVSSPSRSPFFHQHNPGHPLNLLFTEPWTYDPIPELTLKHLERWSS